MCQSLNVWSLAGKRFYISGLLLIAMLFSTAHATIITTHLTHISGNTWQAEYTIENDVLSELFNAVIYFDVGLYENLAIVATPDDWDPLVLQPDPALPDDGIYDVLSLAGGIVLGTTLSGFIVSFDWLSAGMPVSQFFEIMDTAPVVRVVDSGQTIVTNSLNVSEPEVVVLLLMAFGILALVSARRKVE